METGKAKSMQLEAHILDHGVEASGDEGKSLEQDLGEIPGGLGQGQYGNQAVGQPGSSF